VVVWTSTLGLEKPRGSVRNENGNRMVVLDEKGRKVILRKSRSKISGEGPRKGFSGFQGLHFLGRQGAGGQKKIGGKGG